MTYASPTKAVIAAAGFGTRFLPQTKAMPKEMLPLIDKPIIQYVVEELVAAGIRDIIIVTGYTKRSLEDHFDAPNHDLINNLREGGKEEMIAQLEDIANIANFIYVRQKGSYGNGRPLMCVRHLIGDEPFIYAYADDLFDAEPSRFRRMVDLHAEMGGAVLPGVELDDDADFKRYGIIGGEPLRDGVWRMRTIVEKPGKDAAPSNIANNGGYLLPPEFFKYLEEAEHDLPEGKEFYLQPALDKMIADGVPVHAVLLPKGSYCDTGNKQAYLQTVVRFALKRKDVGESFRAFLRGIDL